MPERPLPKTLVDRVKKVASRLDFNKMQSADPRKELFSGSSRLRELDVSTTFPKEQIVLKKAHLQTSPGKSPAKETIRIIREFVDSHNKEFRGNPPKNYVLLKPNAYAVSPQLILMAKTSAPTIKALEVALSVNLFNSPHRDFLENLKLKHGMREKDFFEAVNEYREKANSFPSNGELNIHDLKFHTFVLGVDGKTKKFKFMPVVDLS